MDDLSDEQVDSFRRDGFLIVEEGFLSEPAIEVLRERFAALFAGEYATGIAPDEVNWKAGRDPEDVTRYADYLAPAEMITCWIALDYTHAQEGTIEYVRGSHRWPKSPPDRGSFHAPEDWLAPVRKAAPDGVEPERVPVVVKAGGCTFHHSLTFHRSGPNEATTERRSIGLPPGPGRDALPPDQHRRDLLALPASRRPVAGRVVLPRPVGRVRRSQRLAFPGCRSSGSPAGARASSTSTAS